MRSLTRAAPAAARIGRAEIGERSQGPCAKASKASRRRGDRAGSEMAVSDDRRSPLRARAPQRRQLFRGAEELLPGAPLCGPWRNQGEREVKLLNELYEVFSLYGNFFVPSLKAQGEDPAGKPGSETLFTPPEVLMSGSRARRTPGRVRSSCGACTGV